MFSSRVAVWRTYTLPIPNYWQVTVGQLEYWDDEERPSSSSVQQKHAPCVYNSCQSNQLCRRSIWDLWDFMGQWQACSTAFTQEVVSVFFFFPPFSFNSSKLDKDFVSLFAVDIQCAAWWAVVFRRQLSTAGPFFNSEHCRAKQCWHHANLEQHRG